MGSLMSKAILRVRLASLCSPMGRTMRGRFGMASLRERGGLLIWRIRICMLASGGRACLMGLAGRSLGIMFIKESFFKERKMGRASLNMEMVVSMKGSSRAIPSKEKVNTSTRTIIGKGPGKTDTSKAKASK